MTVKYIINRKIALMVLAPLARAILSMFVGYLTAKEVPPEMVDQFAQYIGAAGIVVFNIAWELIDRGKAVNNGVKTAISQFMNGVDQKGA